MSNKNTLTKVRIDKWLWAARFFKTRVLATEAINGGHVHVNSQRIKPARTINIGDEVVITRPPYTYVVEVLALSEKRGPAAQARLLYQETEQSQQKRELLREQIRLQAANNPSPSKRPDKQQRRKIIRFKNINEV
ncbi:MAG: S4 domain-containing protein [Gammaproteobacteria bacterium]